MSQTLVFQFSPTKRTLKGNFCFFFCLFLLGNVINYSLYFAFTSLSSSI
eukprot:UN20108